MSTNKEQGKSTPSSPISEQAPTPTSRKSSRQKARSPISEQAPTPTTQKSSRQKASTPKASTPTATESADTTGEPLLYGDNPDLQTYFLQRHRTAFVALAFDKANSEIADGRLDNRVCKKREDLQRIIDTVTYWNTMEKRQMDGTLSPADERVFKNFKKKKENKAGAKWRTQYHVEEILLPDKKTCVVVRRMEPCKRGKKSQAQGKKLLRVGRLVVCQEEAFDRINEHHRMSGHLGIELTYNNCNAKYYNITQKMVSHFCKTCPICLEENPILPPALGAAKPIYSYAWRDRFQVDLIDMRKFARPNVYGVLQRWIMVVKDHFTGFTALFSIPYKMAKYVAFELEKYFGLVGYLTIFHTDNGNEFVA